MTAEASEPPRNELELLLETRVTLTVPEAARLLSISRSTAYSAARAGQLPTVRMGRRLLVPAHALRDLLALQSKPAEKKSDVVE
jgi:excisionase family DNA binding protein